jgi:hypothetical protein
MSLLRGVIQEGLREEEGEEEVFKLLVKLMNQQAPHNEVHS